MKKLLCCAIFGFAFSFSLIASSSASAQIRSGRQANKRPAPPEMTLKSPPWESRSEGTHLTVGLETGVIFFQDIQVPTNAVAGERADGTPTVEENSSHVGIPIGGTFAFSYRSGFIEPRLRLTALHASSMMDAAKTTQSSYDRLDGSVGLAVRFLRDISNAQESSFFSEADMHYRRSMFANRSSSHYLDTLMPTIGAGWYQDQGFNFLISGGYGLHSTFAYDAGKTGMAGELSGSSAQLAAWGTEIAYRNAVDTSFTLGFGQELATIEVTDTGAYESFGLSVPEFDRESRTYNLTTNYVKLGYTRRF